jgi:hypothetical protein
MNLRILAAMMAAFLVMAPIVSAAPKCQPTPVVTPSPSPTATPSPTPAPTPTPTPTPAPAGWTLAFEDDFSTWDPSRYFVYPAGWTNHYTGYYDPTIISSDGSNLRVHLQTRDGLPRIAAFCPIPAGSLSGRGDLMAIRAEFRIRADLMAGYKGVPLLWPMSGLWPQDGELDIYESEFHLPPKAFTHHQNGTSGGDQDYFLTPPGTSWQDWHVVTMEWIAGTYANYWVDGVAYTPQDAGSTTDRIPNTPLHLVMQFETRLDMVPPDPSVAGDVMIDYERVWTQ